MKVKVGQFKTHLSSYLRKLKESGEPLEICIREESVAYLTSAAESATRPKNADAVRIEQQLKQVGILWDMSTGIDNTPVDISPAPAEDGRKNVITVKKMRSERDW